MSTIEFKLGNLIITKTVYSEPAILDKGVMSANIKLNDCDIMPPTKQQVEKLLLNPREALLNKDNFNLHDLDECERCMANRIKKPQVREFVENYIIEQIREKQFDKKLPFIFVDCASDKLFQTLVIVQKLLEEGFTNIQIHSIDTNWIELFGSDPAKTINRANQFLSWFSQNNITLEIYENFTGLIKYSELHPEFKPSLITCIDFTHKPDGSLYDGDYYNLSTCDANIAIGYWHDCYNSVIVVLDTIKFPHLYNYKRSGTTKIFELANKIFNDNYECTYWELDEVLKTDIIIDTIRINANAKHTWN